MKTVTGRVVSSKPISLSKAASTLSSFLSTDNGASQALCAYLRRASASFNELKQLHKELKSSRPDRKHRDHRSELFSDVEAAVDNPYRSEVNHDLSHRIEDSERKKSSVSESKSGKKGRESRDRTEGKSIPSVQSGQESSREYREDERVDGETTMARGGNGNHEDGRKRGGELKTEVEDKPSGRVEMVVESSDREKGSVAVENRIKKHKKKSEEKNNDGGEDLVELPTKKKKKKKKREEDADDLLNNSGGAIEKEGMPVLDSKELKRKEGKKRKNRDLEEKGGDDGSEEQQGTKRRKGNL